MILAKPEILRQIRDGRIKFEPYDEDAVGPASIDLTLDDKLRVFNSDQHITLADMDYKTLAKLVDITDGYLLKPGELVLGITKERITLPEDVCGWLNSRSRFARIGLMSHIAAPFLAPGISNRQILEIYNAGRNKIRLAPGMRICHVVLQECRGTATYTGAWKDQEL
ncbi:MAG: dCTP deaminase [Acidobacteria bacterium]|jgi:dCTP deaminase|nr:dCTP deaminase [Acidobacteriota bacterium]